MAPTRPEQPPRRYKLTVPAPIADRLDAYALASHQPAARAAAGLMLAALDRIDTPEGAELLEARRQVQELTGRVEALRRQLAERAGAGAVQQPEPRWEWPLAVLLADAEWWDRWLPRLYELLGRHLAPQAASSSRRPAYGERERTPAPEPMVDERGYADLLGFLFPAIRDPQGTLTWRSPSYAAAAAIADAAGAESGATTSTRAQVWEPVIRHVAEALGALESTGEPGADAYLRLRAEAEITGPWARTLRHLVGEEQPELPRRRLA
jgi:hypothetical protein